MAQTACSNKPQTTAYHNECVFQYSKITNLNRVSDNTFYMTTLNTEKERVRTPVV